MKIIDHHIDEVTKPMLEPIVEMYRYEGAPFISQFNESAWYSAVAQRFVAGDALPLDVVNDTQVEKDKDFGNMKPSITNVPDQGTTVDTFSMTSYIW